MSAEWIWTYVAYLLLAVILGIGAAAVISLVLDIRAERRYHR
jgi:hypothetical protein